MFTRSVNVFTQLENGAIKVNGRLNSQIPMTYTNADSPHKRQYNEFIILCTKKHFTMGQNQQPGMTQYPQQSPGGAKTNSPV